MVQELSLPGLATALGNDLVCVFWNLGQLECLQLGNWQMLHSAGTLVSLEKLSVWLTLVFGSVAKAPALGPGHSDSP